jgi:hypothetical protein
MFVAAFPIVMKDDNQKKLALSALQREWGHSVQPLKSQQNAAYRPCSAFDKGAIKFFLSHPKWFPDGQ